MRVGIIAEYNPFHHGHRYHLDEIKRMYPDSELVLVMSGNFTQRGEPSLISKWDKTKIALEEGIDLVIELPFVFASQSADIFAKGAIDILDELKVDVLVFGSESNQVDDLMLLAKTQLENPLFDSLVKVYLKEGLNYPSALASSLEDCTGKKVNLPNDILGISYIKAILQKNSKIVPVSIKRTTSYHNEELEQSISSATSIRKALKNHLDITHQVPKSTLEVLSSKEKLAHLDDYFPFFKYRVLMDKELSKYQTVDEGIENRLKKCIQEATSFEELINLLKTKHYTIAKLQRMFVHILTGFTIDIAKECQSIHYLRILGFSKNGQRLLNEIKKRVTIPIISHYSLPNDPMLKMELQATYTYASIFDENTKNKLIKEEYDNSPIRL